MLGTLVAVGLSSALAQAQVQQPEVSPGYVRDAQGRLIRVDFALHDRVTVDLLARTAGPGARADQLHVGLALKHSFGVDFPAEEIWWNIRHTFLGVSAMVGDGQLGLRATLLESAYLRHDQGAVILIPANVDIGIPAPFDIALEYELLAVELDAEAWALSMIDFANLAILIDFIRDPQYRHRLAVGPLTAYGIARGTQLESAWTHYFVPMSGARLSYGWETASGRFALGAQLQCVGEARLIGQALRWQRRCSTGAQSEWTLLAINDSPINVLLAGVVGEPREQFEPDVRLTWSVSAGLRLSFPGDGP
ncbi:MAG: hypothetical protein H0U74_04680 [Bradymonadaceae bacterium]|nr:hypothetical protein [Lujinxingiaceae bacterium]